MRDLPWVRDVHRAAGTPNRQSDTASGTLFDQVSLADAIRTITEATRHVQAAAGDQNILPYSSCRSNRSNVQNRKWSFR